jgi:hypothetical protein
MRFKLTVLLVILNVALFGLIFYIDKVRSTRSIYDSGSRLILDPVFVQGLDQIEIKSAASDPWIFKKDSPDSWVTLSPVQWKANPYAIQQLLFQFRKLSWESRFPVSQLAQAGQSLESYNLSSPPIRITLQSGTASLTLGLGAPTEIGNRLYVLSPDGEFIQVISRGLVETLQRDMAEFLDRRIFGLGIEESRVIQVQDRSASNVRVRLERGEAGWRFVSPIEAAADTERVEALIAQWQGMDAKGFEGTGEMDPDLEGNALRLTFEGLNQRETLVLAPAVDDQGEAYYLAKREQHGAVFRVRPEPVETLQRVQDILREKRVLHRHAGDWTSLKVEFGNLSTTLQQLENGSWQVLYTDEGGALKTLPADPESVERLSDLMRTMEAVNFVSDAPAENDLARFGLTNPQRQLSLRKPSGETVSLQIGGVSTEAEGTLLYASTNQSASVFLLRPHILAGIPLNPWYYRERTLPVLPERAVVTRLRLLERASGDDLLEGAGSGEVEAVERAYRALEEYLHTFRVESFISQPFEDPLPLGREQLIEWPYTLETEFELQSATAVDADKRTLHFSVRLGGATQYVGDPQSTLVGRLPAEIIEVLDPLLARFPEEPPSAAAVDEGAGKPDREGPGS